jgi:anti-sigma-K factor RsiG
MSDVRIDGKRRIDQVLGAGFTEGLDGLGTDEVRGRRDLARAELEYLSLLRRLVQGRRDILRAEGERRAGGSDSGSLVDNLAGILSEGTRGTSRGGAPSVAVPEEEITLARRRVERLASDASLSDLGSLSDEDLREAVARLDEEERGVSDLRGRVIEAHDALQEEMKRRLRAEMGNPAS